MIIKFNKRGNSEFYKSILSNLAREDNSYLARESNF